MDDSTSSDLSDIDRNVTEPNLQLLNTAQIVSNAVLVILHNLLLLLLALLNWLAGYVYTVLQYVIFYTPLILQGIQWLGGSIWSVTSHADDVIFYCSDRLYLAIDTSLDTLANCTVTIQHVLPYCAAIPIQVLRVLLDWSKLVGGAFTAILPMSFYTSETIVYLNELNFALQDLSQVSWLILKSLLESGTNCMFNLLISLITTAKYVTYFTIRVLQISCCQVLPTMVETAWSSCVLVAERAVAVPQRLLLSCCLLTDQYATELENAKLIVQLSVQLIASLLCYLYSGISHLIYLVLSPLLSLLEFSVYLLHAAFSTLVPGGLVTILIGLITFWKWYNPTQPHPSPEGPPPPLHFSPPPPRPAPQSPEEELELELEREREERLCVVCTVNSRCAVLLPCRHCCLCLQCSEKLTGCGSTALCPLCRRPIAHVMQIYL